MWEPMIFPWGLPIQKLRRQYREPPTVYAILNSIVNFENPNPVKITELARAGRTSIFDFDYPLSDTLNRADFETMILNHFIMRRINFDTVTAFKLQLYVKLNEIMPTYNKLLDAFNEWHIFQDGDVTIRDLTDNKNGTNTSNNTTNNTINSTGTVEGTNTSDLRYSDTPQTALEDVRDGIYVSDYNYNTDTSNNTSTNNTTNDTTNHTTGTTTDNTVLHEEVSHTPADKMKNYAEFLSTRQNVYTMIFKDLDVLFYQLM